MEKYLYSLFLKDKLTDCILEISENDNSKILIKIHSYILCKNSEYFKRMLKHKNILLIDFHDSNVVKFFLKKLYTGKIKYLSTNHILATCVFCDKYLFNYNISELYNIKITKNDIDIFLHVVQILHQSNKNDNKFLYFVKKNMEKYNLHFPLQYEINIKKINPFILCCTEKKIFLLDYYSNTIVCEKNFKSNLQYNIYCISDNIKKIMFFNEDNSNIDLFNIGVIQNKIIFEDLLPNIEIKKNFLSYFKNYDNIYLRENDNNDFDFKKYNSGLIISKDAIFCSNNSSKLYILDNNLFVLVNANTIKIVNIFSSLCKPLIFDFVIIRIFPISENFIVVTKKEIVSITFYKKNEILWKSKDNIYDADISFCQNFIICTTSNYIVIFSLESNKIIKIININSKNSGFEKNFIKKFDFIFLHRCEVKFLNNSQDFMLQYDDTIYCYNIANEKLLNVFHSKYKILKCGTI